jgi:hypothetical protein
MTAAVHDREVLYQPHPGPQTEFHERPEEIVLFGGSKGPGKTQALLFESLRQMEKPGYKALILRRTFPRLQEMIDRAKAAFSRLGGRWEGQEHRFRFPSGATIAFGHCEHEDSKYNYQGHEYAFLGFDQLEEFTESQFNFLMAQCRTSDAAVSCYVRATANPGGVGHWWIKRRFIDHKKPREVATEVFALPDGRKVTRESIYIPARVHDNPTLLKANPGYLATLMSLPEQERKAFLEGDWNAFTTGCVFSAAGMEAQQRMAIEPSWTGLLRDSGEYPEFVQDEKGRLAVWSHPAPNRRYLITADVGKGANSEDAATAEARGDNPSAALVFDAFKREVVARWYGQVDPTEFGRILFGLGVYFNNALLAPEVWPGPGIATGAKLVEMGYENLYRRTVWDGQGRETRQDVGWTTNEASRQEAIAALQFCIQHTKITLRDQVVLDEMYSFIRKPRNSGRTVRMEARSGCFDDLVICAAIGAHIIENEPSVVKAEGGQPDQPFVTSSLVRLPGQARGGKHGPKWRNRHRPAA